MSLRKVGWKRKVQRFVGGKLDMNKATLAVEVSLKGSPRKEQIAILPSSDFFYRWLLWWSLWQSLGASLFGKWGADWQKGAFWTFLVFI